MIKAILVLCYFSIGTISCHNTTDNVPESEYFNPDTSIVIDSMSEPAVQIVTYPDSAKHILTGDTVNNLVDFAETLIGVPYKYASVEPSEGFDCSGFITYVFNHFNIVVPRSSVDFTNEGIEIPMQNAKRGDLILFTGTDSTVRIVGHMGIVTENRDTLKFIHASSGKADGVVITPFNAHYKSRFVKVIRFI